jgi:hypothetical protein
MRLLLLSLATSLISCTSNPKKGPLSSQLSYDTTKIAIIPFVNKTLYGELNNSNTPFTLTQEDISELENIFLQSVTKFDSSIVGTGKQASYIDLNKWDYKRQYICYKNKKGEKIVYVNCFCTADNLDWHKYMVSIDDGGRCFFALKINLSTKTYFDFIVNGYA